MIIIILFIAELKLAIIIIKLTVASICIDVREQSRPPSEQVFPLPEWKKLKVCLFKVRSRWIMSVDLLLISSGRRRLKEKF